MKQNQKVLMLIKTTGLDYDDRLRKEALSLKKLAHPVTIVAIESANRVEHKNVYNGIRAKTTRLISRNWFKRTEGIAVKTGEMYLRFIWQVMIQKPDIVWIHNLEISGMIPVLAFIRKAGYIKRFIWDHHELPSDAAINNRRYMRGLVRLMNWCDTVVMANEERQELLRQKLKNHLYAPIHVLHNYSDRLFAELPRVDLPESIKNWLGGTPYILAQGGANPKRHLVELVTAVLQDKNLKLIVVGPYHQNQLMDVEKRFGARWRHRVFFTGFVPQLDIAPYIDHAVASAVFYATSKMNSDLCAPNRMYQALSRGTPVIVGQNPPMRRMIDQNKCGVSVDHNDPMSILRGIDRIVKYRDEYRANLSASNSYFIWDNQQNKIKEEVHSMTRDVI